MKRTVLTVLVVVVVLIGGLKIALFPGRSQAPSTEGENAASENVLWRSELFDYAVDEILNRMDHSAERNQQAINRLDQWVRMQKPLEGWQPDPAIAGVADDLRAASEQMAVLAESVDTLRRDGDADRLKALPETLRSIGAQLQGVGMRLGLVDVNQMAAELLGGADALQRRLDENPADSTESAKSALEIFAPLNTNELRRLAEQYTLLAKRIDPTVLEFPAADRRDFQQTVWLRDVARWASGEELDDPVKPALSLFDWVVKNVDLIREPPEGPNQPARILQTPGETLLLGKGTGVDRAWLFILLARQMNIDAALLRLANEDGTLGQYWGVGVLIEGEIYLFEPVLGLPIPKPDTLKLTENGLEFEVATLAEAAADENVLRQMCLQREGDYGVTAKDVQRVVVLVEAGPTYLSQRMKLVERRLAGDQRIVLTTDSVAQIERFRKCEHVVGGGVWPLPYMMLWQEILMAPQRQKWLGEKIEPFVLPTPILLTARTYHFKGQFTGDPGAAMFYMQARNPDTTLETAGLAARGMQVFREMKLNASYWLGLMSAQQGNDRAARDYLETRVLKAAPGGEWEFGAIYNLARIAEETGDAARAIKLYEGSIGAPQTHGNLIRARWLKKLTGQSVPKLEPPAEEKAAEEKVADAEPKAEEAGMPTEAGKEDSPAVDAAPDEMEEPVKDEQPKEPEQSKSVEEPKTQSDST